MKIFLISVRTTGDADVSDIFVVVRNQNKKVAAGEQRSETGASVNDVQR